MREYTTKEQKILMDNPYTYRVTKHKLFFTIEFKKAFFRSYQAGLAPRYILSELGYDVEMFGQKQIDSITQRIKYEGEKQLFTEGESRVRRTKKIIDEEPDAKKIWNELQYLRQEVEFLKKISINANRKGKKR